MGSIWQKQEDELLISTILNYCKKGNTISEALSNASKKLNRTREACSNRWYEEFQDLYKQEIDSIKRSSKRTNDYVGGWNGYEDEKLIKIMVHCLSSGMGKIAAIEYSARQLSRSSGSVSSRWYTYIIKKNKLTIENLIEKEKEKLSSYTVIRNWSKENEKIAINMVKNMVERNIPMKECLIKASDRLGMTFSHFRNYWYSHLYPEHKEELDFLRGIDSSQKQTTFNKWTEEERYQLFKTVMVGKEAGQKMIDIFTVSAATMQKSQSECQNLWYNYLKDDKELLLKYEKEKESSVIKEWTRDEEDILAKIVIKVLKSNGNISLAFKESSVKLNRNLEDVVNQWRKKLQYIYKPQIQKINEMKKQGNIPQQEEDINNVVKEVEQVKEDIKTSSEAISKADELLNLVKALVEKNEVLEKENEKLKKQLILKQIEVNDFKENYEGILQAVEKARKFIVATEIDEVAKLSNN